MSQNEVQRFAQYLREDPVLAQEEKRQPSLDAVLEVARSHGFAITAVSVLDYLCRLAQNAGPTMGGIWFRPVAGSGVAATGSWQVVWGSRPGYPPRRPPCGC